MYESFRDYLNRKAEEQARFDNISVNLQIKERNRREQEKRAVILEADDWHDLCVVMRSLTWGKGIGDDWHRMRKRVNERNGIE